MQINKRIHYAGHVQGVGFRLTTQNIARFHPVTGYVRNLLNGEVELVVEGLPWQVDAFLEELERKMSGNIHASSTEQGALEGHTSFVIRD